MKTQDKNNRQHQQHGGHKGHGWMMIVCVFLMLGVTYLSYSDTMDLFSYSLLGSALIPLILCLVMHGVMMKLMMKGCSEDKSSAKKNDQNNNSTSNTNDDNQFNA